MTDKESTDQEIQPMARLSERVLRFAEQLLSATCPIYEPDVRGDPDLG